MNILRTLVTDGKCRTRMSATETGSLIGELTKRICVRAGLQIMPPVLTGTSLASRGKQSSWRSGQHSRSDNSPLKVTYLADCQICPSIRCSQLKYRTWSKGQLRAKDSKSSSSIENHQPRSTTRCRWFAAREAGMRCDTSSKGTAISQKGKVDKR